MIYRVEVDNVDIYDLSVKSKVLLSPKVTDEINVSSAFDFTMPPMHQSYNLIQPLKSTVKVYEDNDLIFTGRPIEYKIDFWKNKKWHFEGPLSYFNDTIQTPWESDNTNTTEFLRRIISVHNSFVTADRQFTLGNVTVNVNKKLYRKLNYESSWTAINNYLLNAEGGYIFIRHENGINYVDYLAEMPYSTNQPIKFGMNLLDFTRNFNLDDIVTVLAPFGRKDTSKSEEDDDWDEEDWEEYNEENDDEEEEEDDDIIDVSSVNHGSIWVKNDTLFNQYGWIAQTQTWSDLHTPQDVYDKAVEWLADKQYDHLIIEAKASELSQLNPNYTKFKVGQSIQIISEPHDLNKFYPLTKIEIELDSAEKTVTLGTLKHRTLTEIINPNQEEEEEEDWEDEEVGPYTLSWVKYPKTVYNFGESFDYTEARVMLSDSNGNNWDVTDQCTFQPMHDLAITDVNVAPKINMMTVNYAYNKRTGVNVPLKLAADGATLVPAFYDTPAIKIVDGVIVDYDTGVPIYQTIEDYDKRNMSKGPVDVVQNDKTNMTDDVIILTVSCNCTIQMLVGSLPEHVVDQAVYFISSEISQLVNGQSNQNTGESTP